MIDPPDRAQSDGTPGPVDPVAAIVHEFRNPLTAIWNAVHMLALARDEATVEQVRQLITRQVELLLRVVDDLEALRVNGGPGQGSADGDGRPRANARGA